MPNWMNHAQHRRTRTDGYRFLELPDGRFLEWSELTSTGTPRQRFGYLDGRSIDDATLHELISQHLGRRSA